MKIVSTFVSNLHAFKYDEHACDELERLLDDWEDPMFLDDFFEQNQQDLHYFRMTIESAIHQTIQEAQQLRRLLLSLSKSDDHSLERLFRPLDDNEYQIKSLSKQKAKRRWLRLYGIRVDTNLYVITGGAIKLSHKMQDRLHTKEELQKLTQCKDYLRSNGVFDADSFTEMTL